MVDACPDPEQPAERARGEHWLRGAEARPIPREPDPESSLYRCARPALLRTATVFGMEMAPVYGKGHIVRALAHRMRDAGAVRDALICLQVPEVVPALARIVLSGHIDCDEFPRDVAGELGAAPVWRAAADPGPGVLRILGLVFMGLREGRPAVYVPEDLRRPYAEALLGLVGHGSAPLDVSFQPGLRALVASRPVPVRPEAPGLPTARAGRRLPTPGPDRVLELDVRLSDLDVPVTRRLLVSYQRPLGALHEILQVAFGWPRTGTHWFVHPASMRLWANPRRRIANAEPLDEWKSPLRDALATRGSRLLYVIDPPTHWVHEVVTRAIHAPDLVPGEPRVLAAESASPPVDFGNPRGYGHFLAAWRKDRNDRLTEDLAGPDFDPDRVDLDAINRRLEILSIPGTPRRPPRP